MKLMTKFWPGKPFATSSLDWGEEPKSASPVQGFRHRGSVQVKMCPSLSGPPRHICWVEWCQDTPQQPSLHMPVISRKRGSVSVKSQLTYLLTEIDKLILSFTKEMKMIQNSKNNHEKQEDSPHFLVLKLTTKQDQASQPLLEQICIQRCGTGWEHGHLLLPDFQRVPHYCMEKEQTVREILEMHMEEN